MGGRVMSGADAIRILQKPTFGDERHIEALTVYEQLVRLKSLRQEWADEQGLAELSDIYNQDPPPEPEELTQDQIREEIRHWELGQEGDYE